MTYSTVLAFRYLLSALFFDSLRFFLGGPAASSKQSKSRWPPNIRCCAAPIWPALLLLYYSASRRLDRWQLRSDDSGCSSPCGRGRNCSNASEKCISKCQCAMGCIASTVGYVPVTKAKRTKGGKPCTVWRIRRTVCTYNGPQDESEQKTKYYQVQKHAVDFFYEIQQLLMPA